MMPTLGGSLSDNYSWHWCFLINGLVGLLAMVLISVILHEPQTAIEERRQLKQQGLHFDLIGFLLVATFLDALAERSRHPLVMMFVVGRLSAKVQPRYLIIAGALIIALSMYDMTNTYGDLGFWFFARSRMLLGVGLPLIFVSITAASYDGILPEKTDPMSMSSTPPAAKTQSVNLTQSVNVIKRCA